MAEEQFKHSKTLFLNADESCMIFFMRPCNERQELRPKIEYGGGKVTSKVLQGSIKLAEKGSTVSNEGYLSTNYIEDCIKQNELVAQELYRVPAGTRVRVSSGSSDTSIHSFSSDDSMSPAPYIVQTSVKDVKVRNKYTKEEDIAIITFLIEEKRYAEAKGTRVWKDMKMLEITKHTAASMNTRYRKNILPNIENYQYDVDRRWLSKLTGSRIVKETEPEFSVDSLFVIKKMQDRRRDDSARSRVDYKGDVDDRFDFTSDHEANETEAKTKPGQKKDEPNKEMDINDIANPLVQKVKAIREKHSHDIDYDEQAKTKLNNLEEKDETRKEIDSYEIEHDEETEKRTRINDQKVEVENENYCNDIVHDEEANKQSRTVVQVERHTSDNDQNDQQHSMKMIPKEKATGLSSTHKGNGDDTTSHDDRLRTSLIITNNEEHAHIAKGVQEYINRESASKQTDNNNGNAADPQKANQKCVKEVNEPIEGSIELEATNTDIHLINKEDIANLNRANAESVSDIFEIVDEESFEIDKICTYTVNRRDVIEMGDGRLKVSQKSHEEEFGDLETVDQVLESPMLKRPPINGSRAGDIGESSKNPKKRCVDSSDVVEEYLTTDVRKVNGSSELFIRDECQTGDQLSEDVEMQTPKTDVISVNEVTSSQDGNEKNSAEVFDSEDSFDEMLKYHIKNKKKKVIDLSRNRSDREHDLETVMDVTEPQRETQSSKDHNRHNARKRNIYEGPAEKYQRVEERLACKYGLSSWFVRQLLFQCSGNEARTSAYINYGPDSLDLPPWTEIDDKALKKNPKATGLIHKFGIEEVNDRYNFINYIT